MRTTWSPTWRNNPHWAIPTWLFCFVFFIFLCFWQSQAVFVRVNICCMCLCVHPSVKRKKKRETCRVGDKEKEREREGGGDIDREKQKDTFKCKCSIEMMPKLHLVLKTEIIYFLRVLYAGVSTTPVFSFCPDGIVSCLYKTLEWGQSTRNGVFSLFGLVLIWLRSGYVQSILQHQRHKDSNWDWITLITSKKVWWISEGQEMLLFSAWKWFWPWNQKYPTYSLKKRPLLLSSDPLDPPPSFPPARFLSAIKGEKRFTSASPPCRFWFMSPKWNQTVPDSEFQSRSPGWLPEINAACQSWQKKGWL